MRFFRSIKIIFSYLRKISNTLYILHACSKDLYLFCKNLVLLKYYWKVATKVGKRIGLSDNVSFITHHHPKTFSEQMSVIKPLRTTTVL